MRLLFISKRRPQQRDLIERPYGRFFHLPSHLANLGHEVRVQLCSHHGLASDLVTTNDITWSSHDVRSLGPLRFFRTLHHEAQIFKPDWIIGCSDIWFGLLARKLAARISARCAIDAYDNYESYIPWNKPLHWLWRRAIRDADLVTAAGPELAQLMQRHRRAGGAVNILPMAADPEFIAMDRAVSRMSLGLPPHSQLIGYVGSWAKNRGTDMLIKAFRLTRNQHPNVHLVVTGKPPAQALAEPGVISLGYLPDWQLPTLLNALDISCVITAETSFGRYSYPAKLYEAMACGVPVIATATSPVSWILGYQETHLVPVGNPERFSERVLELLKHPSAKYGPRSTWLDQAVKLDSFLRARQQSSESK